MCYLTSHCQQIKSYLIYIWNVGWKISQNFTLLSCVTDSTSHCIMSKKLEPYNVNINKKPDIHCKNVAYFYTTTGKQQTEFTFWMLEKGCQSQMVQENNFNFILIIGAILSPLLAKCKLKSLRATYCPWWMLSKNEKIQNETSSKCQRWIEHRSLC